MRIVVSWDNVTADIVLTVLGVMHLAAATHVTQIDAAAPPAGLCYKVNTTAETAQLVSYMELSELPEPGDELLEQLHELLHCPRPLGTYMALSTSINAMLYQASSPLATAPCMSCLAEALLPAPVCSTTKSMTPSGGNASLTLQSSLW